MRIHFVNETNLLFQPPRLSHPVVKFSCAPSDPMVLENVPFDKYEMEPSPLTQFILGRRQPNVAWQVSAQYSRRAADRKLLGYFVPSKIDNPCPHYGFGTYEYM